MITPKLTENIVFDLVNSIDEFPVDFNLAWKWLEFTKKENAKRSLIECGFEEGSDFRVLLPNEENSTMNLKTSVRGRKEGRKSESVWLTTECFKTWGMMAATQKGKEVRKYFLECERRMRQLAANPVRTDWVLADLMEHDMLASGIMGLAQVCLSLAKEKGQQKDSSGDATYANLAHFLSIAAHMIQTPSPELDGEAEWTPEVEFDNQRWCIMVRDAMVATDRRQALKVLIKLAEQGPDSLFLRSFPTSIAIPGYQRVDDKVLSSN